MEKAFTFPGINKVPSALLDTGKLLRDGKKLFREQSLKKEIKVAEAGPQRVRCHKIAKSLRPTLNHLGSHKMILSIAGHPTDADKVQLSFHQDFHPYSAVKQLDIALEHYSYSMVAQSRSIIDTDKIIIASCTHERHERPARVFSIDPTSWELSSTIVKDEDDRASTFMNCVAVKDDLIVVALAGSYTILDRDLNLVKNYHTGSFDYNCEFIFSLTDSFNKTDIVLVLAMKDGYRITNKYNANNKNSAAFDAKYNALVMKAEINYESGELITADQAAKKRKKD